MRSADLVIWGVETGRITGMKIELILVWAWFDLKNWIPSSIRLFDIKNMDINLHQS